MEEHLEFQFSTKGAFFQGFIVLQDFFLQETIPKSHFSFLIPFW